MSNVWLLALHGLFFAWRFLLNKYLWVISESGFVQCLLYFHKTYSNIVFLVCVRNGLISCQCVSVSILQIL